jgi:hypothetical protein
MYVSGNACNTPDVTVAAIVHLHELYNIRYSRT